MKFDNIIVNDQDAELEMVRLDNLNALPFESDGRFKNFYASRHKNANYFTPLKSNPIYMIDGIHACENVLYKMHKVLINKLTELQEDSFYVGLGHHSIIFNFLPGHKEGAQRLAATLLAAGITKIDLAYKGNQAFIQIHPGSIHRFLTRFLKFGKDIEEDVDGREDQAPQDKKKYKVLGASFKGAIKSSRKGTTLQFGSFLRNMFYVLESGQSNISDVIKYINKKYPLLTHAEITRAFNAVHNLRFGDRGGPAQTIPFVVMQYAVPHRGDNFTVGTPIEVAGGVMFDWADQKNQQGSLQIIVNQEKIVGKELYALIAPIFYDKQTPKKFLKCFLKENWGYFKGTPNAGQKQVNDTLKRFNKDVVSQNFTAFQMEVMTAQFFDKIISNRRDELNALAINIKAELGSNCLDPIQKTQLNGRYRLLTNMIEDDTITIASIQNHLTSNAWAKINSYINLPVPAGFYNTEDSQRFLAMFLEERAGVSEAFKWAQSHFPEDAGLPIHALKEDVNPHNLFHEGRLFAETCIKQRALTPDDLRHFTLSWLDHYSFGLYLTSSVKALISGMIVSAVEAGFPLTECLTNNVSQSLACDKAEGKRNKRTYRKTVQALNTIRKWFKPGGINDRFGDAHERLMAFSQHLHTQYPKDFLLCKSEIPYEQNQQAFLTCLVHFGNKKLAELRRNNQRSNEGAQNQNKSVITELATVKNSQPLFTKHQPGEPRSISDFNLVAPKTKGFNPGAVVHAKNGFSDRLIMIKDQQSMADANVIEKLASDIARFFAGKESAPKVFLVCGVDAAVYLASTYVRDFQEVAPIELEKHDSPATIRQKYGEYFAHLILLYPDLLRILSINIVITNKDVNEGNFGIIANKRVAGIDYGDAFEFYSCPTPEHVMLAMVRDTQYPMSVFQHPLFADELNKIADKMDHQWHELELTIVRSVREIRKAYANNEACDDINIALEGRMGAGTTLDTLSDRVTSNMRSQIGNLRFAAGAIRFQYAINAGEIDVAIGIIEQNPTLATDPFIWFNQQEIVSFEGKISNYKKATLSEHIQNRPELQEYKHTLQSVVNQPRSTSQSRLGQSRLGQNR
ncbi:MAG: hypothetical protein IPP74_04160 [Alphaproteobacteria bacterium]|nr:hypothetical protein [Alphaproteobacteria bacterium]